MTGLLGLSIYSNITNIVKKEAELIKIADGAERLLKRTKRDADTVEGLAKTAMESQENFVKEEINEPNNLFKGDELGLGTAELSMAPDLNFETVTICQKCGGSKIYNPNPARVSEFYCPKCDID